MKKLIMLSGLIVLAACGGISQITPEQEIITENKLPIIEPAKGQLCMFRVANFVSMGSSCDVFANDEKIGRLPNSSYFCVNLLPAEYTIAAKCFGGGRQSASIIITQGQRKYMEMSAANGTMMPQSKSIGLSGINQTM